MFKSLTEMIGWIEAKPLWLGLVVLGAGAGIEYVVPPFPGDTVTVAGAMLIPTAGWPWWGVMAAVLVGSLLGAALDWWVGCWLADTSRETWVHRWLRAPKRRERIERLKQKFQKWGAAYISLNRFIPAFRGLFFVAAGMAGLRLRRVLFYAAVSAVLWNALLLGVGWLVGYNLDVIAEFVQTYTAVVFVGIGLAVVGWIARVWWKKRSSDDH